MRCSLVIYGILPKYLKKKKILVNESMFNLQRNKNGCDLGHLLKKPKLHWIKIYVQKIKLQGVYFRMREVNERLNMLFNNKYCT